MAKIQQEIVTIKVSRLLRDTATDTHSIINETDLENIEAVIQELSGTDVLIEIVKE